MKTDLKKFRIYIIIAFLMIMTVKSEAFALLGPFEPWMTTTNGFYPSDENDIGGPMCISNGYRWNVPVVTYGFDQSFLDFFGTNGVAAVESAIQILNNLPPASQMALTNYPFSSQNFNAAAADQNLNDLKSKTLQLLLEQMGLAQPARYVLVLRRYPFPDSFYSSSLWPDGTVPYYVVERNFDPETLIASPYVNESLYFGEVAFPPDSYPDHFIVLLPSDPNSNHPTVADQSLTTGEFYTGLTYDDVGGLSYLLSTNNIVYEKLLPSIVGTGTNTNSLVNGAWRPGVDKITFLPQPVNLSSGMFLPTTNCFTDTYLTNGILQQQQVARIISQPDFLFSVGDVKANPPAVPFLTHSVQLSAPTVPFFTRTGTTNWLNNAAANGNTNGAGPGVIQPPVQIKFNKLGQQWASDGSAPEEPAFESSQFWASFDGTTNAPVIYPTLQTGTNQMVIRMWLTLNETHYYSFDWKSYAPIGQPFTMQTSTNLTDWSNLFATTNNGSVCTYFTFNPISINRYYRVILQ